MDARHLKVWKDTFKQTWRCGSTTTAKNLRPKTHKWLLERLNNLFTQNNIPTIWRKSKIIAILKPGKYSAIPKNYRPISLLCHTYSHTLNHRLLIQELYNTTQASKLCSHPKPAAQQKIICGTNPVDGENKRMACHKVVYSHQPCSKSTPPTSRSMMEPEASST